MSFVITIDGPAAAGKGTLAKSLAQVLDFAYLDTGSLYRAVGLRAAAEGKLAQAGSVAENLQPEDLHHPKLRTQDAGSYASQVAVQPAVRQALFDFQRKFGLTPPEGKAGAVIDGRDIGTVIFPDAPLKFFITASAPARAQRRFAELDPATRPDFAEVLAQVRERDARDQGRAEAPLLPADDAHQIDTTEMNRQQVLDKALSFVPKGR